MHKKDSVTRKSTDMEIGQEPNSNHSYQYGQPNRFQYQPMGTQPAGIQSVGIQTMAMQPVQPQITQLFQQIQQFRDQALQEQQYTQQQLKQNIEQAITILNQGMQYLQSTGALSKMNQAIDSVQYQLNQMVGQQGQSQLGQPSMGGQSNQMYSYHSQF
ncbi:hypothetical protein L9W92_08750 [Pelotomaculum terephthalicicum JT]|uniref:hypothetical protein n=1 Tax=Pelotomaculum TaxID=191373 RepID=UPI0009D017B5|nr:MULTISPECIES: hypothetical protein [Pelotomaculum]MCG9968137.1 hypothetical protein [Pelotomaculum terephthalicicum JT]OPX83966.1 MAG: hypothetical protein A4E54_02931 [Pelotomaculum sp. PtaB.Bin117]OPY62905.1 MAG: hypothetical protein A4E56_00972 [Pelotomaculum sp. PtaU1.Bin065]